jgi:hypothetical protein
MRCRRAQHGGILQARSKIHCTLSCNRLAKRGDSSGWNRGDCERKCFEARQDCAKEGSYWVVFLLRVKDYVRMPSQDAEILLQL